MQKSFSKYLARVLVLHLGFLAAIVVIVVLAGVALYRTAQAEARSAALERLENPSNLTADAIEVYFAGIFRELSLTATPTSPLFPSTRNAGPGRARPVIGNEQDESRRRSFETLRGDGDVRRPIGRALGARLVKADMDRLWNRLRDDVSDLLVIEIPDAHQPSASGRTGPALRWQYGNEAPVAVEAGVESVSDSLEPITPPVQPLLWQTPTTLVSLLSSQSSTDDLLSNGRDWLQSVAGQDKPVLSPIFSIERDGKTHPALLAAVPVETMSPLLGNAGNSAAGDDPGALSPDSSSDLSSDLSSSRRLLVAVVPADHLRQSLLLQSQQLGLSTMWLLESGGAMLTADGVVRLDGNDSAAAQLPADLRAYLAEVKRGQILTRSQFSGPIDLNNLHYDGALVLARSVRPIPTLQPDLPVPPGDDETPDSDEADPTIAATNAETGDQPISAKLSLVSVANLGPVLRPIAQTTRTAVTWALIVVIAMTAVLVSSALGLIRGRNRLEKLRSEMIERELREARQIQLQWLPDDEVHHSHDKDIQVAAENIPATHISGDFYNYFNLEDEDDRGRCALVIGDVTGHGTGAAFLMATTQMLVRTILRRTGDPGKTLREVNDMLADQSHGQQFVTMLVAVLDPVDETITLASAGHFPPLACREAEDGSCKWQPMDVSTELVLGVTEDIDYPNTTLPLDGSRSLLLFTDGAVEVKNPQGELLDESGFSCELGERLQGQPKSAKHTVEAAMAVIRDYSAGREMEDDVTVLAVHLEPTATKPRQSRREQVPA